MFPWREWWRRLLGRSVNEPRHLRHGRIGEEAACRHLCRAGMRLLAHNFRSERGEIDLILRDHDTLVFVEVKTRSSEQWGRPASAVKARQRKRICRTAFDYLRRIRQPRLKLRFDIVEVLLKDGKVAEVRHLPNCFSFPPPYFYP